jgi:hypothetical protein
MRFVYYTDSLLGKEQYEKFQNEAEEHFRKTNFLKDGDSMAIIQRPGYITEIVALTD